MTIFRKSAVRVQRSVAFQVLVVIFGCTASFDESLKNSAPQMEQPAAASVSFGTPLFGFTTWPYDATPEAVAKTQALILENSNLYAIQIDNGIPWKEALEDAPWPTEFQAELDDSKTKVPGDRPLYIALAPLAEDRMSLAPACKGSEMPRGFSDLRFDDKRIKKAYLKFALRIVDFFKPDYLNLGQEAGQLAYDKPSRWPGFVALYKHVSVALKQKHPRMLIGISFYLHTLMEKRCATAARDVIDQSDYLGLSFYPYASSMGEKMGAAPLPSGVDGWRKPLRWVRSFTKKPIAICETGYITESVYVREWDLKMSGTEALQKAYVEELFSIARRDHYLFVVWFTVVDYDKLYEKLLQQTEIAKMWRDSGLYDSKLRPKPALKAWREGLKSLAGGSARREPAPEGGGSPVGGASGRVVGFTNSQDLFSGPPADKRTLVAEGPKPGSSSMRWGYRYRSGEWNWCYKELRAKTAAGASSLRLWARSDKKAAIVVKIQEADGEAFYGIVVVERDWKSFDLKFGDMTLDATTKKNGKVDAAKITQIILADPAAEEGAKGKRTVWISEIAFRR